MKRLLYLTQYYASADQPGASRHYQHIRHLMARGYKVTLITSYVKNRLRVIPPEYKGIKIAVEEEGDLTIYKTYAYPNYGRDFRTRMLNYLSFMFYSFIAGLKAPPCDLVFASSPSLFAGLAGLLLSRVRRVPFVLEVRDLWPETAIVMGALRNSFMIKESFALAHMLYRKAVRIVAVTEGIRQGILDAGIPADKILFVPNGVDDDLFTSLPEGARERIRHEYGWGDRFVAIYAGTLARSDGLHAIVRAAASFADNKDLLVVFLGDGEVKPELMAMAQEMQLPNVMFIPSQPKRLVPDFVTAADVCLMPVKRDGFFSMTLPNKIFDYMAGGRAVIAAVPQGEAQSLVEKASAGVVIQPEDEIALSAALLDMRDNPEVRLACGRNGRQYVMQHYLRSRLAARLSAGLDAVLENGKGKAAHEIQTQQL